MWQELRSEWRPQGLEVVTVALDTEAAKATRWIDAAEPTHPSLIDEGHVLDELFGVVNVPSGIWIDETGTIVRPPEPAFPTRSPIVDLLKLEPPKDLDPYRAEALAAARKIRIDRERYVQFVRDWIANGANSAYVLGEDEVIRRSTPRPFEVALAAAHFELAHHLQGTNRSEYAVHHFREAHRLHPDNWTYRRQAWSLVDARQGPTDEYESDWLTDVNKIGAEHYYPPLKE